MSKLTWSKRRSFAQKALLADKTIVNGDVNPVWIDATSFWYERVGERGAEYRVVDASTGMWKVPLTRERIAQALAGHLGAAVDADTLIVGNPQFDLHADKLSFVAFGGAYEFAWDTGVLTPVERSTDVNWLPSPDGKSALLLRNANLVIRDLASGDERMLTSDGTEYNAYGDVPAARRGVRAIIGELTPEAIWSPDGEWVLTQQTDDRHVEDMPLADYAPDQGSRPTVLPNRFSLPSDRRVTEFRMVAIEVASGRQVEARYPRLTAVRMNSTPVGAGMVWWSADSRTAYFIDVERGEQAVNVVAFDTTTGATRTIFSEQSSSYVELSVDVYTHALIAPLPESDELVWYSERDGNGHLYLYDLVTGTMRNAITSGPWRVREVLRIDAARREIFFLAGGIAPGENPYVRKPCIASLDGGGARILSDAPGDHSVRRRGETVLMLKRMEGFDHDAIDGLSPSGDYFVETVSSVAELPSSVLRRRDGSAVVTLETAAGELPAGWQAPEPVCCLAADGVTSVYGLLFKPLGYDPDGEYPLVDLIYGGPQMNNVPHESFAAGNIIARTYLDAMHLSAIGAYVLVLDGRGTAFRERNFRAASWGAAHTASNLEDHVSVIRELASRNTQIDLSRVGITGFSGGGYMTAHAALRFGDLFKVAVAGGGNYDQALFWHSWGERYHGAYDPDHYATQAARTYATQLSGKLMLVHGLLDAGCHPAGLFQLVQALIEADKDVDLVVLPKAGHDWTGYGLRRRWDYLATHLTGETPAPGAAFETFFDRLQKRVAANVAAPAHHG